MIRTIAYSPAFLFFFVSILVACSREDAPPAAQSVSDQFQAFLTETYAEDMTQYPQTAVRRGIRDNTRDWNPISLAFLESRVELAKNRMAVLESIDRSQLSPKDDLSWQLYHLELTRTIEGAEFIHHQHSMTDYRGPHTSVPTYLANVHTVKSVADAEDYIVRLEGVEPLFQQLVERLSEAAAAGVYLADWAYPKIADTSRNTIAGAPFSDGPDSPIWADFKKKVKALQLPEDEEKSLLGQGKHALLTHVKPAYEALIAEAERLYEEAPQQEGAWRHPRGGEWYANRLRYFTTTDLSATEIHDIGLREVTRIHAEMQAIMDQVGFEGSLQDFFTFMREDERFYHSNDDEGRAAYLREATELIETMEQRTPEVFGLFPKSALEVRRVEPFREKSAGKAFYQYPAADGSRPGIYYANLYDMYSMPLYEMEALAYHEAVPGHHMQRAITVELEGVPEFQKYTSISAFTEGWGLYSEYLPKEMGFYQDPYSDFGRLSMELWRAARLVVDSGIHEKRWTREQAIDYLLENTPTSELNAVRAIERYSNWPGQATAYMIGKIRIIELREAAREALGDQFDIRGFHDEVLRDGQVTLPMLEAKVDRWVASQQP